MNIPLGDGYLKCVKEFIYLGVVISDIGSLKEDIKKYLTKKRAQVMIKFSNFCKVNRNVPLSVKLDVLEKCVTSSLIYGSECWGSNTHDVELIYRSGLKIALRC